MIEGVESGLEGFDAADDIDDDADDHTGRLVRPYAMTGGRTLVESDIGLETQIQASTRATEQLGAYRWETAQLIELVQTPMALVEVAARMEIPIGVARVLVADLVADGAVIVHAPAKVQNFASLLERVLDGVRNL